MTPAVLTKTIDLPAAALSKAWAAAIKAKPGRSDIQAHEWAGLTVAEALGLDIEDRRTKTTINKALKKWKDDGHFTFKEMPDKERKPKTFIVVNGFAPPPEK